MNLNFAESLFVSVFPTGNAIVIQDIINLDNNEIITVKLFARNITSISITSGEIPLKYQINKNVFPIEAKIKTNGMEKVRLSYETNDIVNKMNREWIISINSTSDITLMLPINSTINFIDRPPSSLRLIGFQHMLNFGPGSIDIRYTIS